MRLDNKVALVTSSTRGIGFASALKLAQCGAIVYLGVRRVNAVLPGFTATDAALDNMSEDFRKSFLSHVPLNRIGTPEDIANAVYFFASDFSSYITGDIMINEQMSII